MATYNKFEDFVNQLGQGNHDFNLDTLNVYLSNAAPSASLDLVKADLAEIATGSGYAGPQDTTNTWAEATGTGTVSATDVTITASGGTVGPFQYVVLHNVTDDGLIAWWDYGSAVTLQDGESFTIDFGADTLFTIA
jgi:hypothetical protein